MRLRLALLVIAAVLLVASPAGASATTTPPVPATLTGGRPVTECISASPPPDCPEEQTDGKTLVLFGVMIAGLTFIGAVVVRSTLRTNRAREASRRSG